MIINQHRIFVVSLFLFLMFFLTNSQAPIAQPSLTEPLLVGFSNPAAEYCLALGYDYQNDGSDGSCVFPDGGSCNDWAFLTGSCGAEHSFCAQNGWDTVVKTDGNNPFSEQYAVCVDASKAEIGSVSTFTNLAELASADCQKEFSAPENLEAPLTYPEEVLDTLPDSFDWRDQPKGNYLTGIRNQGGCGSCWAFAVVGVTEAALNIQHDTAGNNYDLSEQYLVSDCSSAGDCCGGYTDGALSYMSYNGAPDEACLPYVDGSGCSCGGGTCDSNCTYRTDGECSDRQCSDRCADYASRMQMLDHVGSASSDPATIKAHMIDKGPLEARVTMTGSFSNGVYSCSGSPGNFHAIVLVGYDDAEGYWIAKNSWGTWWGDDGYFNIAYGSCIVESNVDYGYMDPLAEIIPIPSGPSGDINDRRPNFSWSDESGLNQYNLQVFEDGSLVLDENFSADAICDGATCTAAPDLGDLVFDTPYTWQVRGNDGASWHPFSEETSFTVSMLIPVTISPVVATRYNTTDYIWEEVDGAEKYQVQLWQDSTLLEQVIVNADICEEGTCSHTFDTILERETPYKWHVRAKIGGWHPYSLWSGFEFGTRSPVAISPISFTNDSTPTYTWQAVEGAYRYQLKLFRGTTLLVSKIVSRGEACSGDTCSVTLLKELAPNPTYQWTVRAKRYNIWSLYIPKEHFKYIPE